MGYAQLTISELLVDSSLLWNSFITDWKKISVNGKDGYYYRMHQCAPQCTTRVTFLVDEDNSLSVIMSTVAREKGYESIFNKMYSSFKLTN